MHFQYSLHRPSTEPPLGVTFGYPAPHLVVSKGYLHITRAR
jgi:hypothetical protein